MGNSPEGAAWSLVRLRPLKLDPHQGGLIVLPLAGSGSANANSPMYPPESEWAFRGLCGPSVRSTLVGGTIQ